MGDPVCPLAHLLSLSGLEASRLRTGVYTRACEVGVHTRVRQGSRETTPQDTSELSALGPSPLGLWVERMPCPRPPQALPVPPASWSLLPTAHPGTMRGPMPSRWGEAGEEPALPGGDGHSRTKPQRLLGGQRGRKTGRRAMRGQAGLGRVSSRDHYACGTHVHTGRLRPPCHTQPRGDPEHLPAQAPSPQPQLSRSPLGSVSRQPPSPPALGR